MSSASRLIMPTVALAVSMAGYPELSDGDQVLAGEQSVVSSCIGDAVTTAVHGFSAEHSEAGREPSSPPA